MADIKDLNPEVASIMSFFHKVFPCKIYIDEVPETFAIPCMYFPASFPFDGNDTISTFMKTYSLSVKLFHKDSQLASKEAERIANGVETKRMAIPLLDEKGTESGDYVRIRSIETRIADSGLAIIQVNWDSRYYYEKESYIPLQNVGVDSGVKE